MKEPLLTGEPMGLLAYMTAEGGMRQEFAAPATAPGAQLQSSIRTVVWRARASRALRGLADRLERPTISASHHGI
jgi:hypothetical protein